jgi:protein SCO1/2
LFFIAIISSFVLYFGVITKQKVNPEDIKISGVYLVNPKEIKDFKLTDNKGNIFTNENLKNHWTMLFFGFTNCGYVCPTTLTELNKMYTLLQAELADNELPQVVLISVDPERDSVSRMDSYVNAFNTHFIGARAGLPETEALEKDLHIAAVKMQAKGKGKNHYSVNHSAEILVVNPKGEVQAYLSFPPKAADLAKDYKLIISVKS